MVCRSRTRGRRQRPRQKARSAASTARPKVTAAQQSKSNVAGEATEASFPLHAGHRYCVFSFQNPGAPDYQFLLKRVSSQKASSVLQDQDMNSDLPYLRKDGNITLPTDATENEILQVLGIEVLGSGFCGAVHKSVCIRSHGFEETLAVKWVRCNFSYLCRELDVYQHLADKPFIPRLYGAFAARSDIGPQGALIMEVLEKVFESYSDAEKRQALACLEQLHEAGYHREMRGQPISESARAKL